MQSGQIVLEPLLDFIMRRRKPRSVKEVWIQEQLEKSVDFDIGIIVITPEASVLESTGCRIVRNGGVDFVAIFVGCLAGPVHDSLRICPLWCCGVCDALCYI